jgi:hypothetical protein
VATAPLAQAQQAEQILPKPEPPGLERHAGTGARERPVEETRWLCAYRLH